MGTKKKTVIIAAAAGAAVICAGLFGIYKYFVTPERVVALSLMNAYERLDGAFDHIDKLDMDIIKDHAEKGGKITFSAEAAESMMLGGMPVELTVNSDGSCSVADISFYDRVSFQIYRDSEQTLVNTPLFGGGFYLPVDGFADEWNSSIFGSIAQVPDEYDPAEIAWKTVKGEYSFSEFIGSYGEELKAALSGVRLEKGGKVNVIINNDTERADSYTADIGKEEADKLVSAAVDYICKKDGANEEQRQKITESLSVPENGINIVFKVKDLMLREAEITIGENKYTAALTGENDPFDDMTFYKNDDTKNAVRRSVSGSNGVFSDKISMGGTTVFTIEGSADGYDIRYNMDGITFDLSARGKITDEHSMSFSDVSVNFNDLIELDGSLTVSNEYDSDFGFTRSGEYVDLLNITEDEWEAVSGTLLGAFDLFSGN